MVDEWENVLLLKKKICHIKDVLVAASGHVPWDKDN